MDAPPPIRSPYEQVAGLFHFGRMLDKARAASRGELPHGYGPMLGNGFDGRLCRYLGVSYAQVQRWALDLADDETVAKRCFEEGREPSEEGRLIWNSFVSKRGWRDDETSTFIPETIRSLGLDDDGSIETGFDLIEYDEGRPLDGWKRAWGVESRYSGVPAHVEKQATIFRRHARPLLPEPTDTVPQLPALKGIRAVVFDIYGTLFISGTGDIGLARKTDSERPLHAALAEVGLGDISPDIALDERFKTVIRQSHTISRENGIEYPEVEIREVWRAFLDGLTAHGMMPIRPDRSLIESLAIDYECRVNPVWPMPHLSETLAHLRGNGLLLGIVSNAQFYTRALFPAFLGQPLARLGFALDCTVFSYQEREAKPSAALYRKLLARLEKHGMTPEQVLYVGNDLRNDIWPAQQVGLRTALFAGDARSLRWRKDDAQVRAVQPDVILSDLYQLKTVIES